MQNKFTYTVAETSFPSENQEEWRKLFKLCASQRIFLPVSARNTFFNYKLFFTKIILKIYLVNFYRFLLNRSKIFFIF